MKKHAFNQIEVLMLERRIGKTFKDRAWDIFINITQDIGFKVRVTGGNFLTHEINGGDIDDFESLLELTKEAI